MLQKNKRIRLRGEKLRRLNDAIHERDGHCCILCGRYVHPGEKFHHEPGGTDKSDVIEQGVTLCMSCHRDRHFGPNSQDIKRKIERYLYDLYGAAAKKERE